MTGSKSAAHASNALFTEDFRESSYWLDGLAPMPTMPEKPLAKVDAAIVGAGYTGISAALEIARGGRSVQVMDSETPGWGCSTRNGGQIGDSVKPSHEDLARRFGERRAEAIRREDENSQAWIESMIKAEAIDCDYRRSGRFHAAHTPRHYEELVRGAEKLAREEGVEAHAVPRAEQSRELGSEAYHGGVVFPHHASVHPAKLYRGLLARAAQAGVHVTGQCRVQSAERLASGFRLQTSQGTVEARDVVIATNGYTSGLTPWLGRRVIPIGSYIIATEPLPEALMNKLFPTDRVVSDTCKVIYYYRASPDRKRVLFGGRVSARETNPRLSAPKLFADMCRIFPDLADYQVSHSWCGTVAYTFDELVHTGVHEGMHYAMGYCGAGVAMSGYLGMRLGQKVLGKKEGQTVFDDLPFPSMALYRGNPWFLPPAVAWYRFRDRMEYRFAQK